MKCDLHTHSIYSDGSSTPEEVVALASRAGVKLLALTDHNTTEGTERFLNACNKAGIEGIRGVEIDCQEPSIDYYSELLAYFPKNDSSAIEHLLSIKRQDRELRVVRALQRASEYFGRNDLDIEELKDMAFRERGFSGMLSNKLTFRYFLSKGIVLPEYPVCQESQSWKALWSLKGCPVQFSLMETIALVHKAGGYAVLPHFGFYFGRNTQTMGQRNDEVLSLLLRFKEAGLWGMELHPYRNDPRASLINGIVCRWAEATGLHLTCGSDYHGGISAHVSIGCMYDVFKGFN